MMADEIKKSAWYSIKEAAEYLEIGEPTLYRWMRDRKITFRKVGDSTRFLQEDLDAVVEVFHSERDAGLSGLSWNGIASRPSAFHRTAVFPAQKE